MIYPSIGELTKDGKINRYELVIATAKCARKITDEYVAQRELAERAVANKETRQVDCGSRVARISPTDKSGENCDKPPPERRI